MTIVAPCGAVVPAQFVNRIVNRALYRILIFDIQKLRGMALRESGAHVQLEDDGRHYHHMDSFSWHVIQQGTDNEILGCAKYCDGQAGGWVTRPDVRGGVTAVKVALASIALAAALGCKRATVTATQQNKSANILTRIGAVPIGEPYYDATYGSMMELLEFDVTKLAAKLSENTKSGILMAKVVCVS